MKVAEYLQREFQTKFTYNEGVVALTTTPRAVVILNPRRFEVLLMNLGTYPVYLSFHQNMTSNDALVLLYQGSFLVFNATEDGELSTLPLYAFSTADNSVYVLELIAE